MKLTTKTIIGTVSTLMVVGMISSLVNGSETYFVGQDSLKRPRTAVRFGQTSVLTSDFSGQSPASTQETLPKRKTQTSLEQAKSTSSQENSAQGTQRPQEEKSSVSYVTRVAPCGENEHPKLVDGKFAGCTKKNEPAQAAPASEPVFAPVACESQGLFTYIGADYDGLLYGTCIPCSMNKFNVQSKTCN